MNKVTLYDLQSGVGRAYEITDLDQYNDALIHVTEVRSICIGRRLDPEPGEGPYVAFWAILNKEHADAEYEKVFGHMSRGERMASIIFRGVELEPELPCEVVNLDGVSVVRVNLDPHVPNVVAIIPERRLV